MVRPGMGRIEHMFESLARAIDDLEVPVDDRALGRLVALADRLAAKVAAAVGAFDRARAWDGSGATSMRSWLVDEGMAGPDATRLARLGGRLVRLPVLGTAWSSGELSGGQVAAVVAQLTDGNVSLFAEHEDALVPTLVGLGVADTDRVMTEWRARADAVVDQGPDAEPERSLAHSRTFGGRFVTDGSFDPEGGAVIATALSVADSGELAVAPPRRRADALVEVCAFFLDHHASDLTPRQRPQVALVVDAADLGRGDLADYDHRL